MDEDDEEEEHEKNRTRRNRKGETRRRTRRMRRTRTRRTRTRSTRSNMMRTRRTRANRRSRIDGRNSQAVTNQLPMSHCCPSRVPCMASSSSSERLCTRNHSTRWSCRSLAAMAAIERDQLAGACTSPWVVWLSSPTAPATGLVTTADGPSLLLRATVAMVKDNRLCCRPGWWQSTAIERGYSTC